ncbi:MAG: LacI family transcriptional regulator [Paenibacillus sp.]|jgi:LacI family transcriptional regulator|nr:LacI family transcriptional regulator [Paenibacillus sp.]
MNRKKKTTLDELANELGISRFTVSKALRGLPGMSEETRQAVLELARKRGYITREQKESAVIEGVVQVQLQQRRFLFLLPSDPIALPEIHLLLMQGIHERYGMSNYQVSPLFIPAHFTRDPSFEEWAEQHGLYHADGVFIPPCCPPAWKASFWSLEFRAY